MLPAILALSVIILPLVACAPGGSTSKSSAGSTVVTDISTQPAATLQVWTFESGAALDLLKKLGDQFHAKYPNITINWTARDFGAYPAQVKLALSGNDAPDVVLGNLGWTLDGPLVQGGLIRPLDDYAKAYDWVQRYPSEGSRQLRFSTDGKQFGTGPIWGVTYQADVLGWFYNRSMLASLGKQVPTTFSELESILAASKAAGQKPIVFGNKDGFPGWHLAYQLIDMMCDPSVTTGIVYNSPGATYQVSCIKQALDKMVEWTRNGYIQSDVNSISSADASAAFVEGSGLFFTAGSWEGSTMGDQQGFFLLPQKTPGAVRHATGTFGASWHVSAKSKNVPAAVAFMDFTNNVAAARAFDAAGFIAPTTIQDPPLAAGAVHRDLSDAWAQTQKSDALLPYLEFATATAPEVMYPQLQALLAGQTTSDAALKALEEDRKKFVASLNG